MSLPRTQPIPAQPAKMLASATSSGDVVRRMACGGLAGMIAKTATAPLERLKMMSQTGEGGRGGPVDIYRRIIRTEGLAGLWAGNGANLVRIFPSKGIVFASNDFYKVVLCSLLGVPLAQDGQNIKAPGNVSFMAGGMAGMTASALTYPLDLVRGRISGKGGERGSGRAGEKWRIALPRSRLLLPRHPALHM